MWMNNSLLQEELSRHEGRRYETYKDTLGLLTCGVGHLLSPAEAVKYPLGCRVPQRTVDEWFEADIVDAIHKAKKHCASFDKLDEVRQRVMVNLAFNLGNKLGQFKKALAAIEARDWNKAADELQNSTWYKQVGRRGVEVCAAMRQGYWSFG
jgi:lysozyme